jgi:cellulose synthase/poly-beta-1,6-N-acetylglucosamine synthase-like glycosyltransferase
VQKASIVVMTHDRANVLERTLNAMLKLDYPTDYEIIVVNDGSTDNTKETLEKFKGKIRVVNEKRLGPCKARNNGIKLAKYPIVVIMDDDCIPHKNWLKDLVKGFTSDDVGMVSAFSIYGGTSTAFRKEILDKVGLYDEDYFYYREDTDLVFRVMDAGYRARLVKANYVHEHKLEAPKSLTSFVKQAFERAKYHKNDVLLYKKHPKRAKGFLGIKFGFLVNPAEDLYRAIGLWGRKYGGKQKKIKLASPRGLTYLENKTLFHTIIIFLMGIFYIFLVKSVRLYASFRFKKPLI